MNFLGLPLLLGRLMFEDYPPSAAGMDSSATTPTATASPPAAARMLKTIVPLKSPAGDSIMGNETQHWKRSVSGTGREKRS
jgi:hypothetical protein